MKVNDMYCRHYGYTRIVDTDEHSSIGQLHAAWRKIATINMLLNDSHTDVVVLLDDDAYINHYWIPVEYYLLQYKTHDIIAGEQHPDPPSRLHNINTGVMIIRNTMWSRAFFTSILSSDCNYTTQHCCWEQDCIKHLLDRADSWSRVAEIPAAEFNCQEKHRNYKGICDPYVWHAMGQGLKHWLEKPARISLQKMTEKWETTRSLLNQAYI